MDTERILMVADGIIVMVSNAGDGLKIKSSKDVSFSIEEFGVVLKNSGEATDIPLPGVVLDHLVNADDTKIHFYTVDPFSLLGHYIGALSVDRDELVKAKGGCEHIRP
jgi:hypothetical protein